MSLIDPIVYYPKVSVGDTVFAIEWVQSIFRMEDKGICLYTNAPPDDEVHIGLFKKSLKLEKGPLHIFMPGGLKTENVTRLNPSYADIGSNVKLDGYYDRIRDRIVLTGDIDILERGKVYDRKQEPPVINKPELVFGKEGTLLPPSRRMIIQLSGCARVEKVDPLIVVGVFIGTRCGDKLLESYNSKKEFGSEYRDIKTEVWNILPGPISEEINYNIGLEDAERIYSLIDPKKNSLIKFSTFDFERTSAGPFIFFDNDEGNLVGMIYTGKRHRVVIRTEGRPEVEDVIIKATNTRMVVCEVMKKLIQRHPNMNRTNESEMRKLEACSRG